jgi:hypothetical protein
MEIKMNRLLSRLPKSGFLSGTISKVLTIGILSASLPLFVQIEHSVAQTCNAFGCSQPGAGACNPFWLPKSGCESVYPFWMSGFTNSIFRSTCTASGDLSTTASSNLPATAATSDWWFTAGDRKLHEKPHV